uniref:DUF4817 domain-containing protein n=1 Tax=Strigamia maritima TaxID=126957 RepID=T1IKD6_STRMM
MSCDVNLCVEVKKRADMFPEHNYNSFKRIFRWRYQNEVVKVKLLAFFGPDKRRQKFNMCQCRRKRLVCSVKILRFDKIDMIFCYGASQENCAAAAILYRERYPNRRHSFRQTLRKIIQRSRDTRSVVPCPRQVWPRTV